MSDTIEAGPAEDQSHPIPRLDALDVHVTTDQGAYVGIIIASALRDDEISRARLQKKVEVSLGYFLSPECRERYGAPSPDRSRLWMNVHMLELIEHYRTQIEVNGVSAVVKFIGTN